MQKKLIMNYQSIYKYLTLFSHLMMFYYLMMCKRKFGIENNILFFRHRKRVMLVIALL